MGWVKVSDPKTGKTIIDSRQLMIKEAVRKYQEKHMSNIQTTQLKEFTPAEIDLIKSTIAKGATNDELKLFLYRCQNLGLDPLKPGQIYFIKYGSNPGTIVVGLEGFRSKAAATNKHTGTQRGIIKDEKGNCVGAWCEVSRSDWSRPAREEVSLHEYNTGKAMWAKMPETMIKKVAEAAALRMAFPDDLGGMYVHEEMDQASRDVVSVPVVGTIGDGKINTKPGMSGDVTTLPREPEVLLDDPGEYVVKFGKKYRGQKIKNIDQDELSGFIEWCEEAALNAGRPLSFETAELKANFNAYVDRQVDGELRQTLKPFDESEQIPF